MGCSRNLTQKKVWLRCSLLLKTKDGKRKEFHLNLTKKRARQ